jgi:N-acyl-D-amino-acid deacylase
MGLKKGTLSIGSDADVTIFDFNKIKDGGSFMYPVKDPEGVEYVIVNGKIALKKSQIINDRSGCSVRGHKGSTRIVQ